MSKGRCDLGSCRRGRVLLRRGITKPNHVNLMYFKVLTTNSLPYNFLFHKPCSFGTIHATRYTVNAVMQRITKTL